MQNFYVYILECSDRSYYIGHTDNIDNRLTEHSLGLSGYTKSRLPITLAYMQTFSSRDEAFAAERKIKNWSHQKKQALICGDWNMISRSCKKKFIKK